VDHGNPTARALLCLELLQDNPGITADRLAGKLGVSDRAARRYVAILREAGIPIESVRGPYGGYRVGRGLRLPALVFSAAEALGLVMAVLDGHHDASDSTSLVGAALGKIVRAPPGPGRQAGGGRPSDDGAGTGPGRRPAGPPDHDHPRAGVRGPSPGAAALRLRGRFGVGHGRRPVGGRRPSRPLVPPVLVPLAQARRAYRVDRVRTVEVLDDTFRPPADLDPVADLEAHLAVGWEYDVEVVIDASADAVAPCVPRTIGLLEPLDATRSRLVGSTSNPTWYAGQLAAIPASYRIVRCPELQQAARVLGQRLLAAGQESTAVSWAGLGIDRPVGPDD